MTTITENEIWDARVGTYLIAGMSKRGEWYDVRSDTVKTDVELVLVARIREPGGAAPVAVDHFYVRPDGKEVVLQWVPADR
jgi:hypothetical protein